MYPVASPDQQAIAGPEPPGLRQSVARLFGKGGVPDVKKALGRTEDIEYIQKAYNRARAVNFEHRQVLERTWLLHRLDYLGRQWTTCTRGRGWVDKRLAKRVPRPVTNEIRVAANAILSVFQAVQLGTIVTPNSNDPRNVSTAETADRLVPLIAEEHEMEQVMALHDFWTIVCGSAILHPWWDKNGEGSTVLQPFEECQSCKTVYPPEKLVGSIQCPKCGAIDFGKAQMGRMISAGRGRTDVISPLEWASNPQIANF